MLYIIVFLLIIVVYLLYRGYTYSKGEPFTTNSKERNVILLGDSTFKNNNYGNK